MFHSEYEVFLLPKQGFMSLKNVSLRSLQGRSGFDTVLVYKAHGEPLQAAPLKLCTEMLLNARVKS